MVHPEIRLDENLQRPRLVCIHRGRRFLVFRRTRADGYTDIVKTVRTGDRSRNATRLLERERRLLTHVQAPGIERLIGVEAFNRSEALVLEDAGLVTLAEWQEHRRLGLGVFFPIAKRLAQLLDTVHRQKVIHGDFNPSNIVVGPSFDLTLVDFDVATRVVGVEARSTSRRPRHAPWGTLPYVAPEQTGWMDRMVDHRADLYALGITLYELLNGMPPFTDKDSLTLIHAHLAREPVALHHANAHVPAALGAMVARLLAKLPEDRYQGADAVLADLQEAERQWNQTGAIRPFELGRLDLARFLQVPDKLYGRDALLDCLRRELADIPRYSSKLVLITGPTGSGKTRLAQTACRGAPARIRKVFGKFDSLQGGAPYAAITQALGQLVRDWMTHTPDFQTALQHIPSGSELFELVPELMLFLGPASPSSARGVAGSQDHLQLACQNLLSVIASAEHPVVICIDDLQWADVPSLNLLRGLSSGSSNRDVLWIGIWRTSQGHGAEAFIRSVTNALVLELGPLSISDVQAFCADALRSSWEEVRALAELIHRKTAGIPLFVHEFLRYLTRSRVLEFQIDEGKWRWDLQRAEALVSTENVLDVASQAIARLPPETRSAVEAAGCFRGTLDLKLLASVLDRDEDATAAALWTALREGVIAPQAETRRPLPRGEMTEDRAPPEEAFYHFVHDRIRDAAYARVPPDLRRTLHWKIGRKLMDDLSAQHPDERLFEAVDQLNLGVAPDASEVIRWDLARLNLRAGMRAKACAGFAPALTYLRMAMKLLPGDSGAQRELELEVHREAAEVAFLAQMRPQAEQLVEEALFHARTPLEKAEVLAVRAQGTIVLRDHAAAIQAAGEGLRLLGLPIPSRDALPKAVMEELAALRQLRAQKDPATLLLASRMKDPQDLACMRLGSLVAGAAWFSDATLFAWMALRLVRLSYARGPAPQTAIALVVYGMMLTELEHQPRLGHSVGTVGVALSESMDDRHEECKALTTFATHVNHWYAPFRNDLALHRRALAVGRDCGEFLFATYASGGIVRTALAAGIELSRALEEIEASSNFVRKVSLHPLVSTENACRQAIRALQGHTWSPPHFDDEAFQEKEFIAAATNNPTALALYFILRLQVAYLLRDWSTAEWAAAAVVPYLGYVRGFINLVDYECFCGLTHAARARELRGPQRAERVLKLRRSVAKLVAWEHGSKENFTHKRRLLAAELATLTGQGMKALRLFEQAIDGAGRGRFLQDEALGFELTARFLLSSGQKRLGHDHLKDALRAYRAWGANAKVFALHEEFPQEVSPTEVTLDSSESSDGTSDKLDLLSILNLTEALTSEVVLPRLLERLSTLCLQVAGAERGALVLEESGELKTVALDQPQIPMRPIVLQPLSRCDLVPAAIVEEAYQTGEAIVLPDAARSGRFQRDPYIVAHGVRSALAIPMRRQSRAVGVLYLENNLVTHAFAPERVRLLRILSVEMAISLENSLLFERQKRMEREIRFLSDASVVLAQSLDPAETLQRLAQVAVPELGDGCVIDILSEDGTLQRRAGASHHADLERPMRELLERYSPGAAGQQPAAQVIRDGKIWLHSNVDDRVLSQITQTPAHAQLLKNIELRSVLSVPIPGEQGPLGAITFGARVADRYDARAVTLAQELARRAKMAIQNAELYRTAKQAIAIREEFLSIASHELRTPLTSLQLTVESLTRPGRTPQDLVRSKGVVLHQVRRLTDLVGELLTVSRIQAGRLSMEPEILNLTSLIREVVERLSPQAERFGSTISVDAPDVVQGRWDRIWMDHIIGNLLSNAIKFGRGRPIHVQGKLYDACAELIVRDSGIGIPPERISAVFGRFERAVSARAYGGLGLGLFIADELVKAHHGSLQIESELGKGTTVRVRVPLALEELPDMAPRPFA